MGYFALTVKPFRVGVKDIPSNTWRRKIERVARFSEETQTYSAAGYLIAQLGKNFSYGLNEKITGKELLDIALDTVYDIQDMAGGMIAFLDAENNNSLIDFLHTRRISPHQRPKFTARGINTILQNDLTRNFLLT